jgi:hypothetical protein
VLPRLGWVLCILTGLLTQCGPPDPLPWLGCFAPSWARLLLPGCSFLQAGAPRIGLGRSILVGPASQTRPGRLPSCPGWAKPGFPLPRPDFPFPGQLSPFGAEIYSLRDISFIRHRLYHRVLVLGCSLAQTGTSSIVICWSWDAPWFRPAYYTLAIASLILRRG